MNRTVILASMCLLFLLASPAWTAGEGLRDITPVGAGAWRVYESTDEMDDSVTVMLRLKAESTPPGRENPPVLSLGCAGDLLAPVLMWGEFMAGGGGHPNHIKVQTRFDSGVAADSWWFVGNDHRSTLISGWGAGPGKTSKEEATSNSTFIEKLLVAKRLTVRATSSDEIPKTWVFQVDGLSEAIKPLRTFCRIDEKPKGGR
jgi:hypothetical protein